jgi:hypothetical protein
MQLAHLRPEEIGNVIETTFRTMLAELKAKTAGTHAPHQFP